MSTKHRLAQELRNIGLNDMAEKAARGHYDDYESELAFPTTELVADLRKAGAHNLAKRAMDGDFDATAEEAQTWYDREGKHL